MSYGSEFNSLTHKGRDLCGIGGVHVCVSVGDRPENNAQTELSNTPFH